MKHIHKLFTIAFLLLMCLCTVAQQVPDTIHTPKRTNIFHYAMRFLKRNSSDTTTQQGLLTTKSEQAFLPYQGRIIRHIFINQYGFEKSFTDTSERINYFGTKVLNKLHRTTKEWAIRNALFIKENTKLLAYRFADNERYLRSLDYIQDARIIVRPVDPFRDSVDVYVITKDLFSFNGQLSSLSSQKFKGRIGNENLFGAAQSVQASVLLQKKRNPPFGMGGIYTKYNIGNTFIDGTVGFTTINPDLRDGTNDERAMYVSLQRNLISQYSHIAGGLTISQNKSFNTYEKPGDIYFNYKYTTFDAWFGYNLGVKKFIKNDSRRDKQFIGFRYFNQTFQKKPYQIGDKLNFRYNDKIAALAQFTFFKQEYYKSNYIYGFGTTEDVPYGYNVAFTTGYYKQVTLSRPYAGFDANRYYVYRKGDIVQYFLRAGSFFNDGRFQDASILFGASGFSRLLLFKNLKMRQYFRTSFSQIFNRAGLDPLAINNPFGIRYYRSDSVRGVQRLSIHSETFSFINYKAFGFKFSPFVFADVAGLSAESNFQKSVWYYGLGAGVRVRNENLVFRTIEARGAFFPRKGMQSNSFYASLRVNINFRYNQDYVREPDIIQLNSDFQNNIF